MQAGERQLVLGLDPDAMQGFHLLGPFGGVTKQRGLADPRLSADDQHAAPSGARTLEQFVDRALLRRAPQQHGRIVDQDCGGH